MIDIISKLFGRNKNKIDDSTYVYPKGRDEFIYQENDRKLILYIELQSGNPSRLIYLTSFDKWMPPHEDELITEADKERILTKVGVYLDRIGKSYSVVDR